MTSAQLTTVMLVGMVCAAIVLCSWGRAFVDRGKQRVEVERYRRERAELELQHRREHLPTNTTEEVNREEG